MVYTILDNVIIIILTILGLFQSKSSVVLIIIAAVLMMRITYRSFSEETTEKMMFVDIVLMLIFSLISGRFSGFLVFFLQKDIKEYVRIIAAITLFVISCLVMEPNMSVAMCILYTLILFVLFLLLAGIYKAIELGEKRSENESQKIIQSNISELHEKRLNEQLIMQKVVDERNARLLERENISRNIHNSVGHSITAAIMTLDAADMLYDVKPEEARKKMNDANSRIRESLESIRRAVRVLDEENNILLSKDLKEELSMVVKEFVMDTSIQIFQNYNELEDDIVLPDNHVVFLTGVLQESLTNGVKHGNANEFIVILVGDSAHIRLEISDNGNSDFDENNSKIRIENGYGLRKIVSYVDKCGGKAMFTNYNGFKMMVELPVFGG